MSKRALNEAQVATAGARYLAGEGAASIAGDLGCSEATLRRWLRKAGITAGMRTTATPAATGLDADDAARDFEDLGDLPVDDPLAAAAWVFRALAKSAEQALRDPSPRRGAEADRRRELREIAGSMSRLIPTSVLTEAKRLVERGNRDLDETTAGAEPVERPNRKRLRKEVD